MKSFVCSLILVFSFFSYAQEEAKYHEMISLLNKNIEEIKELEARSAQLVKEKNSITDRKRVVQIISELNQVQKELRSTRNQVRELDYDLRFKFPKKGDQTERVYKKHNRSSDEIISESDLLIDRLEAVMNRAKKIYGPTQAEMDMAKKKLAKEREEKAKPENRFKPIIVNE